MRNAIYQTAVEIEERIQHLESGTMRIRPDTVEHRKIMQEIAQLRIYSDAKRLLFGSTLPRLSSEPSL